MNVKCPGHSGHSMTPHTIAIYVYLDTQLFLNLFGIAEEDNSCNEVSQQWAVEEVEK